MENKRGQGIFLGVVSVATLIVAIIGATFAFFSASANVTGGNNVIQGGTNDDLANALSATVEKVGFTFTGEGTDKAPASPNLVPTNLIKAAEVNMIRGAVNAKCVNGGYTGCHLYRVTAKSTQTVSSASLSLTKLETSNTTNPTDWQYIIFTGGEFKNTEEDTGTTVTVNKKVANGDMVATGQNFTAVDMHNSAAMDSTKTYVYYILVFLSDDDPNHTENESQNAAGQNNATGTYSGTVTLTAAGGGKITASFTAAA